MLRPADKAWIALGVGVLAWDLLCSDDELLSQASRRYAADHRWLAYVVIGGVALHLSVLPKRVDPIGVVGGLLRELRWTSRPSHQRSIPGSCMPAGARRADRGGASVEHVVSRSLVHGYRIWFCHHRSRDDLGGAVVAGDDDRSPTLSRVDGIDC